MDYTDGTTFIATLLGGLAALLAVAAWTQGRYRQTLGRRRDRYERLARLGNGAQLSFFIAVLGEPPAIRRSLLHRVVDVVVDPNAGAVAHDDVNILDVWRSEGFTECFFIDRDYYVQTISDTEETVLAFSVTTRRRWFRPTLSVPRRLSTTARLRLLRDARIWFRPPATVKLGKTRFADLDASDPDDWAPPHFRAWLGARSASYAEFYSYGNPGHYQTYVFSAGSNAPGHAELHRLGAILDQAGFVEWPYPDRWDPEDDLRPPPVAEQPDWENMPGLPLFRRGTVITTYTVIGPALWAVNFPSTFGPHGDEVRTLP